MTNKVLHNVETAGNGELTQGVMSQCLTLGFLFVTGLKYNHATN